MIPVCSPQLLASGVLAPAQLAHCRLLHLSARHDAWQRWFVTAGVDNPQAMVGARYELFSMLVEAARAGMGVALVPRFLVQQEISSGNLVMPCELPLPSDNAYYLVYPPDGSRRRRIRPLPAGCCSRLQATVKVWFARKFLLKK
jgi:DNA-binding transcriptional LysR family regulator